MTSGSRLAAFFNVEPGEGRLVSLLFTQYFLLGAAFNFVQTAAFTLFLIEYNAQTLPYVYLANAVLISLITFFYLRLGQRVSFSSLLTVNVGFLLLLVVAFRLGLALPDASWVVFALPILFQILVNLGNLAVWPLAGRLFHVRQAKRLFGLVGSGLWVAIVLTGFLMPSLVAWLGTANLIVLSALSLVGALAVTVYLTRSFSGALSEQESPRPAAGESKSGDSVTSLLRNRYISLIFLLVLVWWLGFLFLDNLFYDRAAAQYPDAQQLASFLGLYLGGLGILTLIGNFFLTGSFLNRYGLRWGLLLLPVLLLAATGGLAFAGTFSQSVVLLFWLTTAAKLLDMALGFSIDRSTQAILYQPLSSRLRTQAQTVAEGIVQPVANGLAGLALIGLNTFFTSGTLPLIYALLFILLAWVVIAGLLGRQYPGMLVQALAKRRLAGGDLEVHDASSLAILQKGLESPRAGVVIYSMNMLAETNPDWLSGELPKLLDHSAQEVRWEALERIERLRLVQAMPAIRERISQESSPALRGLALRVLATAGEAEVFEEVLPYLEDPDPHIRLEAAIGLLRAGGIAGVLAAGQKLLQMASSERAHERLLAAQMVGETGVQNYYQPLVPLLNDPDPGVRKAAMRAAGQLKSPKLWPLILDGIGAPEVRGAACSAIAAAGEKVLPEIQVRIERPAIERENLLRLIQTMGRIGGEQVIRLLETKLDDPDPGIRTHVLRALSRCGYRIPVRQDGRDPLGETGMARNQQTDRLQERIRAECSLATYLLACSLDLEERPEVDILRSALDRQLEQTRERIFYLLSFLYDPQVILKARDSLRLASGEKKAYALEVLDIQISQELKSLIFPFLEEIVPGRQLERLAIHFPQQTSGQAMRLNELLAAEDRIADPWIEACALHVAGELGMHEMRDAIHLALASPDPIVREAAGRALSVLIGDVPVLTTIEKVIILKGVSIFAETPDEILGEVARVLEEVEVKAGETLFEKGDIGDSLYVVASGKVRVHDGGHTLDELGEGDVFGEMALLNQEARMASVTAVEDTQLLRLEREPFYELMEDRIEVARGIIQVLSRRLRDMVKDVNDLRSRLERSSMAAEAAAA